MMRYRIRQTAPLAILALMVLLLAGCGGTYGETSTSSGPAKSSIRGRDDSQMPSASEPAKGAMAASQAMEDSHMGIASGRAKGEMATTAVPNQIVIDNFTFNPPSLTVAAGAQVTWVNHDDVPHTVTHSVKPRLFDSGAMDTDDQFSHTFTAPGTYEYFCALHPRMTAKIIVK
jgi:plastocyanin